MRNILGVGVLFITIVRGVVFAQTATVHHGKSVFDPSFMLVSGALIGTTVWDAKTTLDCVQAKTCQESTNFMKPIVDAGPAATYSVVLASDAAILCISHKMRKSDTFLKEIWWLAPVAGIVAHSRGAINGRQLIVQATVRF